MDHPNSFPAKYVWLKKHSLTYRTKIWCSAPLWRPDMIFRSVLSTLSLSRFRFWGLRVYPASVRESFRIREARKSPRGELFTSSAGIKCQKLFGQDRSWKRKESCCGRSLATDRISAKNAWPRTRHRSRQFRRPAARAHLLPDRQIPASRHISRSDSSL